MHPQTQSPREVPNEVHLALLELVMKRDQEAFGKLYLQTRMLAWSIAYQILLDKQAAEEAVQDGYLQVWRQSARFNPSRGTVLAWIATIIRTRSLDRRRALRRELGRESSEGSWEDLRAEKQTQTELHQELQSLVRTALSHLRREERRLIEYAYYTGMSHREMAIHFKIPLGTIKTRLRTALNRLRRSLRPHQLADLLK